MRIIRTILLTGAAAITLAGFAGPGSAANPQTRVLNARLPDGQVVQIEYTGNVPPTIIVAPPAASVIPLPTAFEQIDFGPIAFDQEPTFAMLRQFAAAMDRQAEAMLREANALATMPDATRPDVAPVFSDPGVCMRSVQITYSAHDRAPHVVSRSSGDCGPLHKQAAPAAQPEAVPLRHQPGIVEARADRADPSLIHTISTVIR